MKIQRSVNDTITVAVRLVAMGRYFVHGRSLFLQPVTEKVLLVAFSLKLHVYTWVAVTSLNRHS